jgi:hypothetical protein
LKEFLKCILLRPTQTSRKERYRDDASPGNRYLLPRICIPFVQQMSKLRLIRRCLEFVLASLHQAPHVCDYSDFEHALKAHSTLLKNTDRAFEFKTALLKNEELGYLDRTRVDMLIQVQYRRCQWRGTECSAQLCRFQGRYHLTLKNRVLLTRREATREAPGCACADTKSQNSRTACRREVVAFALHFAGICKSIQQKANLDRIFETTAQAGGFFSKLAACSNRSFSPRHRGKR